ncbi:cation-translocating P-type ATPase [Candidatus Thorarchaeota archaeon]|nr:MAG: cation-translocating P-type ATPase [Candidatus Thorarchaeota archaeon]
MAQEITLGTRFREHGEHAMNDEQWYSKDTDYVLEELDTSRKGLSTSEARSRIERYGYNELIETGKISPLRMFLEQFTDPMVIILLIAIVISVVTSFLPGSHEEGGLIDAIVILAIVIFNAVFGFVQEYRSEQALEALKQMAAPKARVLRDDLWQEIDSREVVPGDILGFESGDKIAADARVINAVGLGVDEAVLTGESVSVRKVDDPLNVENPSVGDLQNMVFQGTTIVSGKGRAVVTETGMQTKFGEIAEMVQESEKEMTPLQEDLADLGKKLGVLVIGLCIIVFAAELIRQVSDSWIEELMAAIALAVSAIPEGLPAVVTITLAIGVQRMVKENAIVRRLPSVETLGSTTVICSDKTGTITKNEMSIRAVYTNDTTFEVTGVGYNKEGEFLVDGKEVDPESDEHLVKLLQIGQLCSNSLLQPNPEGPADWSIVGDPTEAALLVAAEKAGITYDETWEEYDEIYEISFDSARKRMTSICKDEEGNLAAFAKGAPEIILPLCSHIYEHGKVKPLTEDERQCILDVNSEFADKALRILAMAYRPLEHEIPDWEPEEVEKNLVFVGLAGMIDPPRDEVQNAIKICKRAGIRPIMITGDHELTARAVAAEVGLIEAGGRVISGSDIDQMTDEEFMNSVHDYDVYARVSPKHKIRIVEALKNQDQVVAMTGDGVNDAPAVKSANVGVSMGIRGADVTREASDIILTDDNFATIVTAVERGREIYSNIRKFVRFLLAANFDEIFLIFTIIMIGLPLPITPIQILWLNLATDGFPALALGVDPPPEGSMERPPREPGKKMMDRGMATFVLVAGFIAFLSSMFIFLYTLNTYGGWIPGITGDPVDWTTAPWDEVLRHARTAAFAGVVTFELIFVWNCRDEWHPVWRTKARQSKALIAAVLLSAVLTIATVYVPFLQPLFETEAIPLFDWLIIIGTSLPALLIPPHIIFGHHKEAKKKEGQN